MGDKISYDEMDRHLNQAKEQEARKTPRPPMDKPWSEDQTNLVNQLGQNATVSSLNDELKTAEAFLADVLNSNQTAASDLWMRCLRQAGFDGDFNYQPSRLEMITVHAVLDLLIRARDASRNQQLLVNDYRKEVEYLKTNLQRLQDIVSKKQNYWKNICRGFVLTFANQEDIWVQLEREEG